MIKFDEQFLYLYFYLYARYMNTYTTYVISNNYVI